jgi:hypothetical protein
MFDRVNGGFAWGLFLSRGALLIVLGCYHVGLSLLASDSFGLSWGGYLGLYGVHPTDSHPTDSDFLRGARWAHSGGSPLYFIAHDYSSSVTSLTDPSWVLIPDDYRDDEGGPEVSLQPLEAPPGMDDLFKCPGYTAWSTTGRRWYDRVHGYWFAVQHKDWLGQLLGSSREGNLAIAWAKGRSAWKGAVPDALSGELSPDSIKALWGTYGKWRSALHGMVVLGCAGSLFCAGVHLVRKGLGLRE